MDLSTHGAYMDAITEATRDVDIQVVFNNAGFGGVLGPVDQIAVEEFDMTMDVLVRGVFLGMKHAAPVMMKQGSGSIINNGSVAGRRAGYSTSMIYGAAKAAVNHLTVCAAMQLGEKNVQGLVLDLATGAIRWHKQMTADDAFTAACVTHNADPVVKKTCGPDIDFGSSAILRTLPNGKRVLLAGQKSGVVYGMDPGTGEVRWQTRLGQGGPLGGIEYGMAADRDALYVAIADSEAKPPAVPGGLTALDIQTGKVPLDAEGFPKHTIIKRGGEN